MQRALLLALLGVVLASSASAFMVPATKLVGAPSSFSLQRQLSVAAQTPAATSRALLTRLMAMKQVGVGVIGAGRIGIVHLEALAGWYVGPGGHAWDWMDGWIGRETGWAWAVAEQLGWGWGDGLVHMPRHWLLACKCQRATHHQLIH